jgi:site-specific DNA recombinase
MKTAYQYVRISDDDQSNFSISGQQKMNDDYALKHDIRVLKTFSDDGYSAKDFNRPSWKELEKELSKNKNKVDYLIVWKYDRLIRNAAEGLAFIEKLEQKWNIKLLSVMENFFIDPHSPYFFKSRADLLVNAEFERRVISDRSKFGIWSAKTQGRFIGVAPFGYDNARDQEDKPIIVINPLEKPIVEQIFQDFIGDIPFPLMLNSLKQKGFPLKGHDALIRLLSNHTYAGLVVVPSYKDELSTTKKGIHEAIIPEDIFWKVYYKLQDKIKPQGPKTIDENIPLRGFLLCQSCGKLHTGAKSKGKLAYYYYYRCNNCRNENYNADKVHGETAEILKGLSFKEKCIKAILTVSEKKLDQEIKQKNFKLNALTKEHEQLTAKIDALEEKYISDRIEDSTYQKWFPIYQKEIRLKETAIAELQKDDNVARKLYKDWLPYLNDLNYIYDLGKDVKGKQSLLKGIFPGCLTKEKQGYGTPFINPLFYQNSLKLNHLLRIKNKGEPAFSADSPFSTRDGT